MSNAGHHSEPNRIVSDDLPTMHTLDVDSLYEDPTVRDGNLDRPCYSGAQDEPDVEYALPTPVSTPIATSSPFTEYRSHMRYADSDSDFDEPAPASTYQIDYTPPRTQHHDHDSPLMERTFMALKTPDRPKVRVESGRLRSRTGADDMVFNKDYISQTPSKEKNDEWLEGFGINLSLLRLTESEEEVDENRNPNITPKEEKRSYRSRAISNVHELKMSTLQSVPPLSEGLPSQRTSRRMTDFHGNATPGRCRRGRQSMAAAPITAARSESARKSRRSSARVSSREMRALMESASEVKRASSSESEGRDSPNCSEESGQPLRGSEVFLTPVRASRRQKASLGTENVVTPVRRSLRISRRNVSGVAANSDEGRAELLEANNYAYIPNRSIQANIS